MKMKDLGRFTSRQLVEQLTTQEGPGSLTGIVHAELQRRTLRSAGLLGDLILVLVVIATVALFLIVGGGLWLIARSSQPTC